MKQFGHVGDSERVIAPEKIPVFDQTHVDYLIKQFNIGAAPPLADSLDAAVRVISWASCDAGQRDVINHIQALVNRKGAQ